MVTKGYTSPIAIHPSETIRELLEELDISQVDLSVRTKLSERTISEIVNGKQSITLDTALKLERAIGISKEGLMKMQNEYDSDLLRLKEAKRLMQETEYLNKFSNCYTDLKNLGFVQDTRNKVEKVESLLRFFAVNSLASVKCSLPVAFRKSKKDTVDPYSVAAWLRIGKIKSEQRNVRPFNSKKLRENLMKMRSLTTEDPKVYSHELAELCAESGVVLVYTPHLKKAPVNGATYWLAPDKVLIQTSLRHRYADIFWFTLFHEIGHVLKHGKKEAFLEFQNGASTEDEKEKEADVFAQELLIPNSESFSQLLKDLTPETERKVIKGYAKEIGVHEGIVAGRIARETGNWRNMAKYRQRLEFAS